MESGSLVELSGEGTPSHICARYVVHATGRPDGLFRPVNPSRPAVRTAAICGILEPTEECPHTLVEACHDGWWWGAPVSDRFSAMLFLGYDNLKRILPGGLEDYWRSKLAATELFKSLSHLALRGRVFACDSSIYEVPECIGPGWIRAGEASFSVDPLSSSGVEKAMQTAVHASAVLRTLLRNPDSEMMCYKFYRDRQQESFQTHRTWAADFYRLVDRFAAEPFWRVRSIPTGRQDAKLPEDAKPKRNSVVTSTPFRLSQQVSFAKEACLIGGEIRPQTAISHPNLDRPLAFLSGIPIDLLLRPNLGARSEGAWVEHWAHVVPRVRAKQILNWLIEQHILVYSSTV
jgi:flavin-dependent dehydrogenase